MFGWFKSKRIQKLEELVATQAARLTELSQKAPNLTLHSNSGRFFLIDRAQHVLIELKTTGPEPTLDKVIYNIMQDVHDERGMLDETAPCIAVDRWNYHKVVPEWNFVQGPEQVPADLEHGDVAER